MWGAYGDEAPQLSMVGIYLTLSVLLSGTHHSTSLMFYNIHMYPNNLNDLKVGFPKLVGQSKASYAKSNTVFPRPEKSC